jgi:hypothetical protein
VLDAAPRRLKQQKDKTKQKKKEGVTTTSFLFFSDF